MSPPSDSPGLERPLEHLIRVKGFNDANGFVTASLTRHYNHVIIAGMGGSGISGALVADICGSMSKMPITVLRVSVLPQWADEDTLVMVVSYSGNTREMLSLYSDARARGCGVYVITSGGKLKDIAERDDVPRFVNSSSFMPRSDIGFVVMDIVAVLKANDSDLSFHGIFRTAVEKGIEYASKVSDGSDPIAKDIAARIGDKIPFIYSSEAIRSVADRWKAQINENAKTVAAAGVFPEFCHNSLEAWGHSEGDEVLPVLLRTSADGPVSEYMDVCASMLEDRGSPFLEVCIPGDNLSECVMNGIILGDYVSLELAELKGVDPQPVPAITEFKERLRGGNRSVSGSEAL